MLLNHPLAIPAIRKGHLLEWLVERELHAKAYAGAARVARLMLRIDPETLRWAVLHLRLVCRLKDPDPPDLLQSSLDDLLERIAAGRRSPDAERRARANRLDPRELRSLVHARRLDALRRRLVAWERGR